MSVWERGNCACLVLKIYHRDSIKSIASLCLRSELIQLTAVIFPRDSPEGWCVIVTCCVFRPNLPFFLRNLRVGVIRPARCFYKADGERSRQPVGHFLGYRAARCGWSRRRVQRCLDSLDRAERSLSHQDGRLPAVNAPRFGAIHEDDNQVGVGAAFLAHGSARKIMPQLKKEQQAFKS